VLLTLLTLGCSSGSKPDSFVPDLAADFVSDSPADLSPGDSVPGDATADASAPGAALSGRLLDEEGAPIPKVMLILCGNLDGVELCNQQFSGADGTFGFSGLSQGYNHLQVLPYPSFHETGKPYCGMVLPVELPALGDLLDLGDLGVPLAETTTPFVVATGGDVAFSRLSVHIQPDSLSFPGLEDEAQFGIARVAAEDAPFSPSGAIEAFSFHPFACGLTAPAAIRYTPDGIGPTHIILLSNSMDTGGLVPLDSHVDGASVVAEVSELTWVVVTVQ